MRIFSKLLLLFATVGLLPLICLSLIHLQAVRNLGDDVAASSGATIIEAAQQQLKETVENYGKIIYWENQVLELLLQNQARAVEQQLATEPSSLPEVYYSEDYDVGINVPPDLSLSDKHWKQDADGQLTPYHISLQHVDFSLPPGISRTSVWRDIARLAKMAPIYRQAWKQYSNMLVWTYTGLENGLFSGYPGTGGLPDNYDARQRPWYQSAKASGGLTWNPPHVDASGMGIVSNLSMPVYLPDGSLAGVTAMDVCNVQQFQLPQEDWAQEAQVFLVMVAENSGTGRPGLRIIGRSQLAAAFIDWQTPLAESWLVPSGQPADQKVIAAITAGQAGTVRLPFDDKPALWGFGPVGTTGTALAMIVPEEDLLRKAHDLRVLILGRTTRHIEYLLLVAALTTMLIILLAYRSSAAIARPLQNLSLATKHIAKGELETELPPVATQDEIGELARAVETMRQDLQVYIKDLTESTAARERLTSELKIARTIQLSFLPKRFPEFPGESGYEVFAKLISAREVGGDLYDFFELEDRRLFFAIGDVADKGVPAALFMAMSKSIMKGLARTEADPASILDNMNRELCQENDTGMFVTLFCGILDTTNGEVIFANGGHNPPLLLRAGQGAQYLDPNKALVLGGFETTRYVNERLTLNPGDGLLLYTDGVTEALSPSGELFGAKRLLQTASPLTKITPREAIGRIMQTGLNFCADAPQADDIALLMLRYCGK